MTRTLIPVVCLLGFCLMLEETYAQHSLIGKEKVFNSYADEANPILSDDGNTLYLIRAHHSGNVGGRSDIGDIWYSSYDGSSWSSPKNIGYLLNNRYHNGVVGFDEKGRIYLYNIYEEGGVAPKSRGVSFASPLEAPTRWMIPSTVSIRYFYNVSDLKGISLSYDRKIMLLSLESFKSRGAEDIYVSFWVEELNQWSEPKNLGDQINTPFQELSPYLAPDNKTIFFASNGHGGYGSRDIFTAKRLDDSWTNWSEPKNMGAEINTSGAEMFFQYYHDKELAIYTSTMNSDGYGDLHFKDYSVKKMEEILGYEMELPVDTVQMVNADSLLDDSFVRVNGEITDANSGLQVRANVRIEDPVGFNKDQQDVLAYSIGLPYSGTFQVIVQAEGYLTKNMEVTVGTSTPKSITRNIALDPIVVGTTVNLKSVLFKRGTTDLMESSYQELDLVAEMMATNPSMEIELSGHTDNQGNAKLNRKLSQDRVNAVVKYLQEKGVDKKRMSGKGYGGAKPIASNRTESTRRLNRRVEFTIVKE